MPVVAMAPAVDTRKADGPVPFQEGMPRPVEIQGKEIVFSREARAARVSGVMIVKCVITPKGGVENCRVIKGLPHMNEAVVQSLQARVYKPIVIDGRPTAVDYPFVIRLVPPRER